MASPIVPFWKNENQNLQNQEKEHVFKKKTYDDSSESDHDSSDNNESIVDHKPEKKPPTPSSKKVNIDPSFYKKTHFYYISGEIQFRVTIYVVDYNNEIFFLSQSIKENIGSSFNNTKNDKIKEGKILTFDDKQSGARTHQGMTVDRALLRMYELRRRIIEKKKTANELVLNAFISFLEEYKKNPSGIQILNLEKDDDYFKSKKRSEENNQVKHEIKEQDHQQVLVKKRIKLEEQKPAQEDTHTQREKEKTPDKQENLHKVVADTLIWTFLHDKQNPKLADFYNIVSPFISIPSGKAFEVSESLKKIF